MTPTIYATINDQRRLAQWFEFILTLLVCAVLWHLATPLTVGDAPYGLGHRYQPGYLENTAIFTPTYDPLRFPLSLDAQAVNALHWAPQCLAVFGLVGWLALQVARSRAEGSLPMLIVCMVFLGGKTVRDGWFDLLAPIVFLGSFALSCLLVLLARLGGRVTSQPVPVSVWRSGVWPGWLLLTGIAWLWIADFAARGPLVLGGMALSPPKPGVRYLGMYAAEGWWFATCVLLLCAKYSREFVAALLRACVALSSLWQRARGPWALLLLGMIVVCALAWLGARSNSPIFGRVGLQGVARPHMSGELLRLFVFLALAWFAYRVGEWGASRRRAVSSAMAFAVIPMLCGVYCVMSDDKGPALILVLTTLVLAGVWVVHRLNPALSGRGTVIAPLVVALIFTALAIATWRAALTEWAPRWNEDATRRERDRQNPFAASSPNLAQARWLMAAASMPSTALEGGSSEGFGLARIPYCGAKALAGRGECTTASGAPLQMPSDFALAPLVATWGGWSVAALLLFQMLWLMTLPLGVLAVVRRSQTTAERIRFNLFAVWVVAVPSVGALAQTLVTIGGTLTWSPLAGVTLPLLGYGSAALCVAGIWVGIASNPPAYRAVP